MWGLTLDVFVLLALASFRLTRLVVSDKITEFIRMPFFDEVNEQLPDGSVEQYLVPKPSGWRKWVGELLSCYWCVGMWISAFLLFSVKYIPVLGEPLVWLLAIAAAGAIIEVLVRKWLD